MSKLSSGDVFPKPDFILFGVGGEEYEVSRVVLSQHSAYFRNIFAHPDSKECQQGRYVFSKEIDPKNHLKQVVDFIKTNDIKITSENAFYILKIADFLQVANLESTVKTFIERVIVTEGKQRGGDVFKIFKVCCEFKNSFAKYKQKTMEILSKKSKDDIDQWNMEVGESYFIELISYPSIEPKKQLVMFMENNPSCSSMVQDVMLQVAKSPIKLFDITPPQVVYLPPNVLFTLVSSNNLKIFSEYDICLFIQDLLSVINRLKIDKGDDFCTRIWENCKVQFFLSPQSKNPKSCRVFQPVF